MSKTTPLAKASCAMPGLNEAVQVGAYTVGQVWPGICMVVG